MARFDKFQPPDDAYSPLVPSERFQADSHIKEFEWVSADLLKYANGAAPDDLDKLRTIGVDAIVYAICELRDVFVSSIFNPPKNELVKTLYGAVLSGKRDTNPIYAEFSWPEYTLRFLLAAGFDPARIKYGLMNGPKLPPDIQDELNAAAERLELPVIFEKKDDI